jgi:hypothetical protein
LNLAGETAAQGAKFIFQVQALKDNTLLKHYGAGIIKLGMKQG